MKTLFVRVSTSLGPRTSVMVAPDEPSATEFARALADSGCVVCLHPAQGGHRSVAELVEARDAGLRREINARTLAMDIARRAHLRVVR